MTLSGMTVAFFSPLASIGHLLGGFLFVATVAVFVQAFLPVRRKSQREMTMGPEWLAEQKRRAHQLGEDR